MKQSTPTIVIMTGNKGKVAEIKDLFSDTAFSNVITIYDVMDTVPEIIEDGATFQANAIKKVDPLAPIPNHIFLSDDSGLSVDALDGRPGIYSARYGGVGASTTEQCELILKELGENTNRKAHYTCAIALKFPNGHIACAEDYFYGDIAHDLKGSGGFGYDPIFIPKGETCHVAEMPLAKKQRISHRYKALVQAIHLIEAHLEIDSIK